MHGSEQSRARRLALPARCRMLSMLEWERLRELLRAGYGAGEAARELAADRAQAALRAAELPG